MTGDEKAVKIEGAGMELKDYQQLNFKGQSLILDLNATGVHYVVVCREKDETENKIVNGSSVSVSTGRKIPDGFKGQGHNVDTEIRLYKQNGAHLAHFVKDRSDVHRDEEIVEDLTLLEYQSLISNSAKNKDFVIKNGLSDAVKTEIKLNMRDLGLDENEIEESSDVKKELSLDELKANLSKMLSDASPIKKNAAKNAVEEAGLSTRFRSMTDIEELKKVAAIMEKELA